MTSLLALVTVALSPVPAASALRPHGFERSCQGRWAVVRSPNIGANSKVLTGVWAAAPDDVWTVGWYYDFRFDADETLGWYIADNGQRSAYRTLIAHHC